MLKKSLIFILITLVAVQGLDLISPAAAWASQSAPNGTKTISLPASIWNGLINYTSRMFEPFFSAAPVTAVQATVRRHTIATDSLPSVPEPTTPVVPKTIAQKVTYIVTPSEDSSLTRTEFESRLKTLDSKIGALNFNRSTPNSPLSKEQIIDLIAGSVGHNAKSLGNGITNAIASIQTNGQLYSPILSGGTIVNDSATFNGAVNLIGNAKAPRLVAHVQDDTDLSKAYRMVAQGNYLYVDSVGSGLTIYDVSDPSNPAKVSTIATGSGPEDIAVAGNYAYLAGFNGLRIYDVSNPKVPKLITAASTSRACVKDVEIQGKYAYLTYCGSIFGGGLEIFDISNPAAPRSLSFAGKAVMTGEHPILQGNYLYGLQTANGTNGFFIADVSNPLNPYIVNASSSPLISGAIVTSVVSGKYVYTIGKQLGDSAFTIQIFNVSDPVNPTLVNTITRSTAGFGSVALDTQQGLSVRGNLLYVSGGRYTDLAVIDVSNPLSPRLVSFGVSNSSLVETPYLTTNVIQGNYLYEASWVGATGGSLSVIDISGATVSNLEAGSLKSANLSLSNDLAVIGNAVISGGVSAASGLFSNGIGVFSSSTAIAALTVSGNSYFSGLMGIGTTSPYAALSVGSFNPATTTLALRPVSGQTANILDLYNTSGTLTSVINPAGKWGIGTSSPLFALSVSDPNTNNVAQFTGSGASQCTVVAGTGWSCTSDARLKTDVNPLSSSLDKVLALSGVSYHWKSGDTQTLQVGFIAQDVEKVIPELVRTDESGTKSLLYAQVTPYLVEAIKELNLKIDRLIGTTTPAVEPSSLSAVLLSVGGWVEGGFAHFTDLFADKLHVKTGFEINDQKTGDIYCVSIQYGEWSKLKGDCSASNVGSTVQSATIANEHSTSTTSATTTLEATASSTLMLPLQVEDSSVSSSSSSPPTTSMATTTI